MTDEHLRVLKMLEEGAIDTAEAERLLNSLDELDQTAAPAEPAWPGGPARPSSNRSGDREGRPRWIRVRVDENGRSKVNIRIPYRLASWALSSGLKIGRTMNIEGLDNLTPDTEAALIDILKNGQPGKFIEVDDEHSHVEIGLE